MYIKTSYLIGVMFSISSCSTNLKPTLAPEAVYNSRDLKVISSMFNNRLGTMSILYGNNQALVKAKHVSGNHSSGEIFTLVTWKKKPMPNWYGSDINGQLETIERVTVLLSREGDISFTYSLKQHSKRSSNSPISNQHDRIKFIINQSQSISP